MQQVLVSLGGVLGAMAVVVKAAPGQPCLLNAHDVSSPSPSDIAYICDQFRESLQGTILSPCGSSEDAYEVYSLICNTPASVISPPPDEQPATLISSSSVTITSETTASDTVTSPPVSESDGGSSPTVPEESTPTNILEDPLETGDAAGSVMGHSADMTGVFLACLILSALLL